MKSAQLQFGTDGWRAVLADQFTFANVRRLALASAAVAQSRAGRGARLLVGYDTRFLSGRFAAAVAATARAAGADARLCDRPTPTPALSLAVRQQGAALGVVVTASHNPPEWNGIKLKGSYGGPAFGALVREVEQATGDDPGPAGEEAPRFNALPAYLERLASAVDLRAIGAARLRVAVDAMHGAAGDTLVRLLSEAGLEVVAVRTRPDPTFGGLRPEPTRENLGPLVRAVRHSGAALGLCTDGDADRLGAVDASGSYVDAQHLFALLLRHLVEGRGQRGTVAKTFAVGRMADRLAARHGLPLRVLPIGFGHVTELMLREDVLIGGEEAGGIGVQGHIPERDGPLCCLLVLESIARTGRSLAEQVDDLHRELGPHYYAREDLRDPRARPPAEPPAQVEGLPVTGVDRLDGLKVFLGERGWLLWRASGTEPLVRVYAELDDPERLRAVLAAGCAMAIGGGEPASAAQGARA